MLGIPAPKHHSPCCSLAAHPASSLSSTARSVCYQRWAVSPGPASHLPTDRLCTTAPWPRRWRAAASCTTRSAGCARLVCCVLSCSAARGVEDSRSTQCGNARRCSACGSGLRHSGPLVLGSRCYFCSSCCQHTCTNIARGHIFAARSMQCLQGQFCQRRCSMESGHAARTHPPLDLPAQTAAWWRQALLQHRRCVHAAAQEDGSATETEAPSAPAGSEQPGEKVEVPDVSHQSVTYCTQQWPACRRGFAAG